MGRRDFLRVGGLGIGGLTLTDLLKVKAIATEQGEIKEADEVTEPEEGARSRTSRSRASEV